MIHVERRSVKVVAALAMAFAVASLRAAGPLEIRDVANVATSFPGFVPLARTAGLAIS